MSLPERKWQNFWEKQFTLVQEVLQSSKYCTMNCDVQSPFLISKTTNNSPLKSRHYIFPVPFCSRDLFFSQQLVSKTNIIALLSRVSSPFCSRAPLRHSRHYTSLSRTNGKWARTLNKLRYVNSSVLYVNQYTYDSLVSRNNTLAHQHGIFNTSH